MDAVAQTFGELLGHPAVGIAIRFIALYLVIVWIASAWWVWRDARTRSTDAFVPYLAAGAVILVTPLLFPLAVLSYRMVRPPLTVSAATSAELQMAMLEEEATHSECAMCGALVDDEWVACPACGSELAVRCVSCGRPLELDWRICAWCAAEVPWDGDGRPTGPALPREAVAIAIRPGGRPLLPVMAAPEAGDEPEVAGSAAARRRRTSRRSAS
jgi:DNA-directed RNA polymerase subunit RPC12/RpoP